MKPLEKKKKFLKTQFQKKTSEVTPTIATIQNTQFYSYERLLYDPLSEHTAENMKNSNFSTLFEELEGDLMWIEKLFGRLGGTVLQIGERL